MTPQFRNVVESILMTDFIFKIFYGAWDYTDFQRRLNASPRYHFCKGSEGYNFETGFGVPALIFPCACDKQTRFSRKIIF